jgi:hypothetical protein
MGYAQLHFTDDFEISGAFDVAILPARMAVHHEGVSASPTPAAKLSDGYCQTLPQSMMPFIYAGGLDRREWCQWWSPRFLPFGQRP